MRRIVKWGVVAGAAALLFGVAAQKPAAAQDWRIEYRSGRDYRWDRDRDRDHWRHERWERERRERQWREHERWERMRRERERWEREHRNRDWDRDHRWRDRDDYRW